MPPKLTPTSSKARSALASSTASSSSSSSTRFYTPPQQNKATSQPQDRSRSQSPASSRFANPASQFQNALLNELDDIRELRALRQTLKNAVTTANGSTEEASIQQEPHAPPPGRGESGSGSANGRTTPVTTKSANNNNNSHHNNSNSSSNSNNKEFTSAEDRASMANAIREKEKEKARERELERDKERKETKMTLSSRAARSPAVLSPSTYFPSASASPPPSASVSSSSSPSIAAAALAAAGAHKYCLGWKEQHDFSDALSNLQAECVHLSGICMQQATDVDHYLQATRLECDSHKYDKELLNEHNKTLSSTLRATEEERDRFKSVLTKQDAALHQLKADLKTYEETWEKEKTNLMRQLNNSESAYQMKDKELTQVKNQLDMTSEQSQRELQSQSNQIAELERELRDRERELNQKTKLLKERDTELASKDTYIREKERELKEKIREGKEKDREIKELLRIQDGQAIELAGRDKEIEKMKMSFTQELRSKDMEQQKMQRTFQEQIQTKDQDLIALHDDLQVMEKKEEEYQTLVNRHREMLTKKDTEMNLLVKTHNEWMHSKQEEVNQIKSKNAELISLLEENKKAQNNMMYKLQSAETDIQRLSAENKHLGQIPVSLSRSVQNLLDKFDQWRKRMLTLHENLMLEVKTGSTVSPRKPQTDGLSNGSVEDVTGFKYSLQMELEKLQKDIESQPLTTVIGGQNDRSHEEVLLLQQIVSTFRGVFSDALYLEQSCVDNARTVVRVSKANDALKQEVIIREKDSADNRWKIRESALHQDLNQLQDDLSLTQRHVEQVNHYLIHQIQTARSDNDRLALERFEKPFSPAVADVGNRYVKEELEESLSCLAKLETVASELQQFLHGVKKQDPALVDSALIVRRFEEFAAKFPPAFDFHHKSGQKISGMFRLFWSSVLDSSRIMSDQIQQQNHDLVVVKQQKDHLSAFYEESIAKLDDLEGVLGSKTSAYRRAQDKNMSNYSPNNNNNINSNSNNNAVGSAHTKDTAAVSLLIYLEQLQVVFTNIEAILEDHNRYQTKLSPRKILSSVQFGNRESTHMESALMPLAASDRHLFRDRLRVKKSAVETALRDLQFMIGNVNQMFGSARSSPLTAMINASDSRAIQDHTTQLLIRVVKCIHKLVDLVKMRETEIEEIADTYFDLMENFTDVKMENRGLKGLQM